MVVAPARSGLLGDSQESKRTASVGMKYVIY